MSRHGLSAQHIVAQVASSMSPAQVVMHVRRAVQSVSSRQASSCRWHGPPCELAQPKQALQSARPGHLGSTPLSPVAAPVLAPVLALASPPAVVVAPSPADPVPPEEPVPPAMPQYPATHGAPPTHSPSRQVQPSVPGEQFGSMQVAIDGSHTRSPSQLPLP